MAFIDSDDYADPDLLRDTVRAAQENSAELVLFNYRLVVDGAEQGPYLDMADEGIDLEQMGLANYFYRYWMPYRHRAGSVVQALSPGCD